MIRHAIGFAAAMLAMATGAAADAPFSWTGTYDGFFACDRLTVPFSFTYMRIFLANAP